MPEGAGTMKPLRIGTRGSPLALWQANHVISLLAPHIDGRQAEVVVIETAGDLNLDSPLVGIGGDGVFTKELQRALLNERIDLAVHSLKDLPTQAVEGLSLAGVPIRGPRHDVLVSNHYATFDCLPIGGLVATSSLRRKAHLLHRRPDLRVTPVRGNIQTRLRKLSEGLFDAMLLAEAGLVRLHLTERIREKLSEQWMLPAVGQGALGLECRAEDGVSLALARSIEHHETRVEVTAERALLRALGGGCQLPVGAWTDCDGGSIRLLGSICKSDGSARLLESDEGPAQEAEKVGERLAATLVGRGALDLLASGIS